MEEFENQNPQENASEPNQEYKPAAEQNGANNYSSPMPQQSTDGFAIASLVLGAVGIFLSCCCTYLALPAGIVGLVFGIIGARQHSMRQNLAVAGIVLSALAIIFAAICVCVLLIMYGLDFSGLYYGIEDFFDIV